MSTECNGTPEDEAPQLIMFCRAWCGDCRHARIWLQEHNIPYTEIDVDEDLVARARAASHNAGRLHTPTFEFGDGVCVDFRCEELMKLLGIE
jgi:glutaredoxin